MTNSSICVRPSYRNRVGTGNVWIGLVAMLLSVSNAHAFQGEDDAAPLPGQDRQNRGLALNLDFSKEPSVVWKFTAKDAGFAAVAAYDGTTIALDRAGRVHCLDTRTGQVIWRHEGFQFSFGYGLELSCQPELDVVFVGGDLGLTAIDRRTGALLWKSAIELGVAGPAFTGDLVVAGSSDGNVYGLDAATGEIEWRHEYVEDRPDDPDGFDGERARFTGRPARPRNASTDGSTVFLSVFDQCRTLALDAATGERRWSFETQGWMGSRPSVGDFSVFVASQDKHFYAIDKDMGAQAWKIKTGSRTSAPAAIGERVVLFGSCDGNVYCVDRFMGNMVWKYETELREGGGAPIYSQPILAGDTVIVPAMRGKVYGIDLASGELKWKMEPLADSEINGQPQVDEGMLILTTRTDDGAGESAVVAIGYPE